MLTLTTENSLEHLRTEQQLDEKSSTPIKNSKINRGKIRQSIENFDKIRCTMYQCEKLVQPMTQPGGSY